MSEKHQETEQSSDEDSLSTSPKRVGLVEEFVEFLMDNKKWWMIPIVVMFALLGVLFMFSGTAAAPFIYTLF